MVICTCHRSGIDGLELLAGRREIMGGGGQDWVAKESQKVLEVQEYIHEVMFWNVCRSTRSAVCSSRSA